jgi:hypothetical protein
VGIRLETPFLGSSVPSFESDPLSLHLSGDNTTGLTIDIGTTGTGTFDAIHIGSDFIQGSDVSYKLIVGPSETAVFEGSVRVNGRDGMIMAGLGYDSETSTTSIADSGLSGNGYGDLIFPAVGNGFEGNGGAILDDSSLYVLNVPQRKLFQGDGSTIAIDFYGVENPLAALSFDSSKNAYFSGNLTVTGTLGAGASTLGATTTPWLGAGGVMSQTSPYVVEFLGVTSTIADVAGTPTGTITYGTGYYTTEGEA